MRSTRSAAERVAFDGVMLALAFGLSYVEFLIPFNFGIPGVKTGLANIVVLVLIYLSGPFDAAAVSALRVILSSLLFGNPFSFLFSAAGALVSFLVMYAVKDKLSIFTVSMLGGVSHNIGQFLVGMAVIRNFNISWYLPVLVVSGILTGLLTSALAKVILKETMNKSSFP